MKTLFITAHPLDAEHSTSLRLAKKFMEDYKQANPSDEVKEINLYDYNIDFLRADDLNAMFNNQESKVLEIAKEFAQADKYVFASPMWNLSIPAIFKAYIDYITYVGVTFKYTENGPVGLLENKKALYILSTGGLYSNAPEYNMAKTYVEGILGFLGISDMKTVMLEGTNVVSPDELKVNYAKVENQLSEMATKF